MRRQSFLTLSLLFVGLSSLFAQSSPDLTGRWEGILDLPSMELRMYLNTTSDADSTTITIDVPQQGMSSLKTTELSWADGQLSFKVPDVPGNSGWSGQYKVATSGNEVDSLIGEWQQGGNTIALNFARPSGPLSGPRLSQSIDQLKAYAERLLEKARVPGAGIAVVHGDQVVADFGVGFADLEAKRPATGNTVFAIGSSSKAFTAYGLGLLVDQGKLEWDKPIIEYLPDFRMKDEFATREMTAVDLLTHRSGLPRHDFIWYANSSLSRGELFQRLRHLEPTASFRSAWQYQNLMYMTAGILAEKLSGKSWEDFTRENIFEPLDMHSANFDINTLPSLPDFAYGYEEKDEELVKLDYHPLPAIGPAGSINASAADMGKWVSLHLNQGKYGEEQLIESGTMQALHTPQMPIAALNGRSGVSLAQYALGWMVYDWNDTKIIEHGGNIDGFSALVFMAPEEEFGIVVLTNKNGTGYGDRLARYAVDLVKENDLAKYEEKDEEGESDEEEEEESEDDDDEDSAIAGTTPHHELEAYAGVYHDPGYGDITVSLTENGEGLTVNYGDWAEDLEHRHFEVFRFTLENIGMNVDLNFRTAADGKVVGLAAAFDPDLPDPIEFKKQVDDAMISPEYLNQLAGTYQVNGADLVVKRKGEGLTLQVPGQPTYDLEAYAEHTFNFVVTAGYSAEFIWEDDKVVAMVLHQPNGDFRAERK